MRGGGRGGGGRKVRPSLPYKLTKELESGEHGGGPRGRGRGGRTDRKDRRKEERQAKKHRPKPQLHAREEFQRQGPSSGGKRSAPSDGHPSSLQQPANKKARQKAPPLARGGSRFSELLPPPEDPEKVLQRELARKLGLKKGRKLGGDDGMDELLEELGGIDDILESESEEKKRKIKGAKEGKKKYAAMAPSESDVDDDDDDDDDDDESEDDESHLGGISEMNHEHDDLGFDLSEGYSEEEEESDEVDSDDEESDGLGALLEEESSDDGEDKAIEGDKSKETARLGDGSRGEGSGGGGKYVPPAVRRAQLAAAAGAGGAAPAQEEERIIRRVRGLLNRLAETNLPGIVGELAELYESEGRSVVGGAVSTELLAAAAEGPRASERFAAVAAAAVTGLAGMCNSSAVIAIFLDKVASTLEYSMSEEKEDSLAAGNLVQVIAHLFLSGALRADLIFSLLDHWRERFNEADVVAMAGLLAAAGLALRAADPEKMKEFVVAVHTRAAESARAGAPLSMRAQVMLDLVVDIKNNRKREDGRKKTVALDGAAAKWLRGCSVGAVALGGISWKKVLTGDKRGNWWMPTAADAAANLRNADGSRAIGGSGAAGAAAAAAGIGSDAGLAAPELLKLAAAMRMNTDSRRAVFCAVMGSEDAMDAFEKLLRLGLKGDQEREIVRVTVECCLQEGSYNPYYSQVLLRLCNVGKGHRITLQYCLWDHLKEVSGMDVRRMTNLARLTATVISQFALSSTMLKAVDFAEVMSARQVLFWRLFFEHCLAGCKTDEDAAAVFSKIAKQQQLGALKIALAAFLKRNIGPWLANKDPKDPGSGGAERLTLLLKRCRLVERVLLGRF